MAETEIVEEAAPGVHEHELVPSRAQMRDDSSKIKSHASTVEAEEHAARVASEYPGRVNGEFGVAIAEKPAPGSTPWTSTMYVNDRHSADGQSYAIGDTIPEAEARRQGVLEEQKQREVVQTPRLRVSRTICTRCNGTGRYGTKPKGHQPDCGCKFCGVCPRCEGTRYEKEVA